MIRYADAPFPTSTPAARCLGALLRAMAILLLTAGCRLPRWQPSISLPRAAAPPRLGDDGGSKDDQAELDRSRRDASVVELPELQRQRAGEYAGRGVEAAPLLPPRNGALVRKPPAQPVQQGQLRQQLDEAKRQVETWTSLERRRRIRSCSPID